MAFNKPSLLDVTSFDATEEQKLYFNVNGGDLHTQALVVVTERNKPTVVYRNLTLAAESSYFVLPANSLENDKYYSMTIQLGDGETWSEKSQPDYFSCFAKPQVSISDIALDGSTLITTTLHTFTGTYSQTSDPIRYYRFKIFDANNKIFFDTGNVYDSVITTQIGGFENDSSYAISLEVVSQSGIGATTGKIPFKVKFAKSNIESQMDVICDTFTGDVTVKAVIREQEGIYYDYIDKTLHSTKDLPKFTVHKDNDAKLTKWLDLSDTTKAHATSFEINEFLNEGYTLQLWFARKKFDERIEIAKFIHGKDSMVLYADTNAMELECAFNGNKSIYGIPITPLTTPVNETVRIVVKECSAEVTYAKGGALV